MRTSSLRSRNETLAAIEGERFVVLPNKSLQILSAEKDDSGEYVCVAFNSEGKSVITALLDVKGTCKTPRITLRDTSILLGRSAVRIDGGCQYGEADRSTCFNAYRSTIHNSSRHGDNIHLCIRIDDIYLMCFADRQPV